MNDMIVQAVYLLDLLVVEEKHHVVRRFLLLFVPLMQYVINVRQTYEKLTRLYHRSISHT